MQVLVGFGAFEGYGRGMETKEKTAIGPQRYAEAEALVLLDAFLERHGYGKRMKYELAQLLVKQFSELATRVGLTCKAAQSGEWEVVEPEDDLRATITVTTGGNNPRAARPVDAANTGHRVAPADQRHQTTPRRDAGRQERTARNRALAGRAGHGNRRTEAPFWCRQP